MIRGVVGRLALLALLGVAVGGIVGTIFLGDPLYVLAWPIALTAFLITAGVRGASMRRAATSAGRLPGLVNPGDRLPASRPEPAQAVLNPPSTAVPATGALLNGEPIETARATPGRSGSGMPTALRRAIALAVVLAVAALTLIPAYRVIGWTVSGIAQGRWDAADPRTGRHQQEMVDDLAAAAGGYDFVSIGFYDGYVLAQAPTTPTASTTDNFEWRYGRAARLGPANGVIEGLFDASRIDFDVIGDVVARAKADAGWGQFTSVYPGVHLSADDEPEITVSLANDYYAATYTFSIEGELLDSYGTGLD